MSSLSTVTSGTFVMVHYDALFVLGILETLSLLVYMILLRSLLVKEELAVSLNVVFSVVALSRMEILAIHFVQVCVSEIVVWDKGCL